MSAGGGDQRRRAEESPDVLLLLHKAPESLKPPEMNPPGPLSEGLWRLAKKAGRGCARMMKKRRGRSHRVVLAGMMVSAVAACASTVRAAGEEMPLSDQAKQVKVVSGVHTVPSLTAYTPEKPNGTAVVVCPGGGYQAVVDTYEGDDVCKWWNERGVTAFLLRYRVAPNRYPAPQDDLKSAIRTIRAHAKDWNVDPKKVGVMGFSAGGHLVGCSVTMFEGADRPDFGILVYPVVSMVPPLAHAGSRDNLLGKDFAKGMDEKMSLERRVTDRTPPCFLVHGKNDKIVDVRNSEEFDKALAAHGVKHRLVELENGPHGFGIKTPDPKEGRWTDRCVEFLKEIEMLP